MFRPPLEPTHFRTGTTGSRPRNFRGFTLVETLMAMTILTLVSMVLAGLVMAVQTAQEHTQSLEEITLQARATLERMDWMISQAGVYELPGQPPTPGLAVVNRQWLGLIDLPEVLVVWSGGRDGGISQQGILQRLPQARELVIYTPDPDDPARLVELTLPNNTATVNFRSGDFPSQILNLINSAQAEKTLLCNRVQTATLDGGVFGGQQGASALRFDLTETPSTSQINSTVPGTQAWVDLPWSQGICSSTTGLRQISIRLELQLNRNQNSLSEAPLPPTPFFGSFTHRYCYEP